MKILTIDIGSYSIKFIESSYEKKVLIVEKISEITSRDLLRRFDEQQQQQSLLKQEEEEENKQATVATSEVAITEGQNSEGSGVPNSNGNASISNASNGNGNNGVNNNSALNNQLEDLQLSAIKDYIVASNFEGKILLFYYSKNLTSRYLNLPVTGRKKAMMMLPYQLEKDIPFLMNEIHFAAQLIPQRNSSYIILSISELNLFDTFFKKLEQKHILPDYFTSELSAIQSIVDRKMIDGSICIIDIGHETTKAYLVSNRKVVSNHLSYIGGKVVTENIAETYGISFDEATAYKHKSAFFLTEKQFSDASIDQQEFAKLMKQIFTPLFDDFNKWELGFRINFGEHINTIYLCGGSSNIKNICNFFTQVLSIKTQLLDMYDAHSISKIKFTQEQKTTFSLSHIGALGIFHKLPILNFRSGAYAIRDAEEMPLYSITFIGARVLIFSIFVIFCLLIERGVLIYKNEKIDKEISKLLLKPEINISKAEQRRYINKPNTILQKLQSKEKILKVETDFIRKISQTNEASYLITINKMLKTHPGWELSELQVKDNQISIKFKILDDITGPSNLRDQIKMLPFKGLKLTEDISKKIFVAEFKGK
ncbi:MAG: pilus assembly protein PilM [Oligoflexia bacterium]|nr:pilus assembly protein PilM [Oligoflexia bacterium]